MRPNDGCFVCRVRASCKSLAEALRLRGNSFAFLGFRVKFSAYCSKLNDQPETLMTKRRIGIAGAGIGGLTAAIALLKQGHDVVVFEQAKGFFKVGADINLTPNAVCALDGLGEIVAEGLRKTAARPDYRISRDGYTGEETSRLGMSAQAEENYGAPQLTIHRADLIQALADAFPLEGVQFDKRLTGVEQNNGQVVASFADGSNENLDILIGADGIHSTVRTALLGEEKPQFTGVVAYRAVVPTDRVKGLSDPNSFTKWWGPVPEVQIVNFPLNRGEDIFIFATTPQDDWHLESWTTNGEVSELADIYKDFHPEARALLDACDSVLKSALYIRDPLPKWHEGRMVLMGDACHPMMPFMAQGAGQAIEDAIVLARCLEPERFNTPEEAFDAYQALRLPRTSKIQIASRSNTWLRKGESADWLYAYNAWEVPLA